MEAGAQDLAAVLEQALRVYAALGALLIALVETEWERLFVLIRFAEAWIGRALLQVRLECRAVKVWGLSAPCCGAFRRGVNQPGIDMQQAWIGRMPYASAS